jgi:hypothetical protein
MGILHARLAVYEKMLIEEACRGTTKKQAAKRLGITIRTLFYKLRKYKQAKKELKMSWNAEGVVSGHMHEDWENLNLNAYQTPVSVEVTEQFEAAKRVARALVDGKTVGKRDDMKFRINLNGHANPGHEPTVNYSNDYITVSVVQAS